MGDVAPLQDSPKAADFAYHEGAHALTPPSAKPTLWTRCPAARSVRGPRLPTYSLTEDILDFPPDHPRLIWHPLGF